MRVEHEGVGEVEARHRRAAALGERQKAAVRAVDVQPGSVPGRDAVQGRQVVHGAGVGAAGGGDHAPRHEPGGSIGRHPLGQRAGPHPEPLVDRDLVDAVDPDQPQRPADRRMGLGRRIGHPVRAAYRAAVAGDGQADEVRRRPAACDHAFGPGVEAQEIAEPPEHLELDDRGTRPALIAAGEDVEARGEHVGDHSREGRRHRNVGEHPRVVVPHAGPEQLALQPAHELDRVAAFLGRRLGHALGEIGRRRRERWPGPEGAEMLDDRVDCRVPQLAHLLRGEIEPALGHEARV